MKRLHPLRRCDGVTRRDVLRVGGLGALSLTLADWFALRCAAGDRPSPPGFGRAKSCILIWLDGGPSHLETFDLKPEAPREVRGPFAPIDTVAPGVQIAEYLPRTALVMDRVAVVRSVTSTLGEHNFGSQYLLTGYRPSPALVYPSLGSVVAHERGAGHFGASGGSQSPRGVESPSSLPPYIAIPDYNAAAGEGYLPAHCRPFAVGGDPAMPDFAVRDLNAYPEVTPQRLRRRREFLEALDGHQRAVDRTDGDGVSTENANQSPSSHLTEFERAYRLMTSPQAKRAFDLAAEPAEVRARYGGRTIGQSCLLARRLVEAGVPFVTVTDRGWDTHDRLFNRLKEGYTGGTVGLVPSLDLAYSALIADLDERGLLEETLVVLMGEFGRTPKLNALGGRDHWPRAFSVVLAGGGIVGGQVVGRSDARGEGPADRAVTPADLAATIVTLLGIDPARQLVTTDGRPVRVSQGEAIGELI